MTREEMLDVLAAQGQDAEAYYNDELDGWFGWDVEWDVDRQPVLVVRFTPHEEGVEPEGSRPVAYRWRLEIP
jgi:hypothetical protein